jgi:hypothetical protein
MEGEEVADLLGLPVLAPVPLAAVSAEVEADVEVEVDHGSGITDKVNEAPH